MNFFQKLILSYILLITLPFGLSVFLLGKASTETIQENTLTYLNVFVDQISSNIDSYVSELDRMTKVASLDNKLCHILTDSPLTSPTEIYLADQHISQYILNLTVQQPNIKNVTLIGENGSIYTGSSNSIQDLDEFYNMVPEAIALDGNRKLFISQAHTPSYLSSNPKDSVFCVVRKLYKETAYIGTIVLYIDCNSLLKVININPSLIENGSEIIITNSNQQMIAEIGSEPLSSDVQIDSKPSDDILNFSNTSEYSKLTTTVSVEKSQLFEPIERFQYQSTLLILLLMMIIILISAYFSWYMVRPIKLLRTAAIQFANGDYNTEIPQGSSDEIGQLCHSFHHMTTEICHLMDRVYLYQIKNKQAQLHALQNQINPHFLYNTLETIRMKAVINSDTEVADMIKLLAKSFRITLDMKEQEVTIQDELDHIYIYAAIQNMRFPDRFHLEVDVPQALTQCWVIKLVFQPLVENCMIHGFSNLRHDAVIHISVREMGENLLIRISDNGCGIEPALLKEIQSSIETFDEPSVNSEEKNRIGIVNIAQRISLEYGKEYGLNIDSNSPSGTIVTMIIPKHYGKPC